MEPFTAIAWGWHLSNEIHVNLGLGHWLLFSLMLTIAKLTYAGHRDSNELRDRRARR